jgi:hypothetical protein
MADAPPPAADPPEEDASSSSSSSSSLFAPPTHPAALGKSCALCGADFSGGKRLMRCGGCRAAHYCSREHQAAHWDAHARDCAAEVARREAQEQSGGLVLGAEAAAARDEEKAAAAAAAEAAADRARIEKLDVATLRLELDRRGALAGLPADASREALVAARLSAPAGTAATRAAAYEREERASLLRTCRACDAAIAEEPASTSRCSGCRRVRYCGSTWATRRIHSLSLRNSSLSLRERFFACTQLPPSNTFRFVPARRRPPARRPRSTHDARARGGGGRWRSRALFARAASPLSAAAPPRPHVSSVVKSAALRLIQ